MLVISSAWARQRSVSLILIPVCLRCNSPRGEWGRLFINGGNQTLSFSAERSHKPGKHRNVAGGTGTLGMSDWPGNGQPGWHGQFHTHTHTHTHTEVVQTETGSLLNQTNRRRESVCVWERARASVCVWALSSLNTERQCVVHINVLRHLCRTHDTSRDPVVARSLSLSHTHTPVPLSCVCLSCYCEEGRFFIEPIYCWCVSSHTNTHVYSYIQ